MEVPKIIFTELEELVGLSLTDSGSTELNQQIDKVCEVIKTYFEGVKE